MLSWSKSLQVHRKALIDILGPERIMRVFGFVCIPVVYVDDNPPLE